jgi:protoporphyrinogen oxidase
MKDKVSDEDIIKADKDLQDFFDSLGPNDVYKIVFLEVLLEEIYGKRVDLLSSILDKPSKQKPS